MRATRRTSPIDYTATISNAKIKLNDYWFHKARANALRPSLRSPVIDGMPKTPSFDNGTEKAMVTYSDEASYTTTCEQAVEGIEREDYRIIIRENYFVDPMRRKTWYEIAQIAHLERSTYYDALREALFAFASTCSLVEIVYRASPE